MMERIILHADLNCFYASVEMLYHPEYRSVPLVVCGDIEERHGIILTKNKHAKLKGIKTGEAIWQARKKCPNLVVLKARFKEYIRYSQMVKAIFHRFSSQVESFGIDEAWIDVSHLAKHKSPEQIAHTLKETVLFETGLSLSIGIANNKVYAKLASDMATENSYYALYDRDRNRLVYPLDVSKLLYVGRSTTQKLKLLNVTTIQHLAEFNPAILSKYLGKMAYTLITMAQGYDTKSVDYYHEVLPFKSVGNSTTTNRDLLNLTDVKIIFTVLAESISARLKEANLYGQVISISVKTNDLNGHQAQMQLKQSSNLAKDFIDYALKLFKLNFNLNLPIRALGISISHLTAHKICDQFSLFDDPEEHLKEEAIEKAMSDIRRRFGYYTVSKALIAADKKLAHFNPQEDHVIHPVGYFK